MNTSFIFWGKTKLEHDCFTLLIPALYRGLPHFLDCQDSTFHSNAPPMQSLHQEIPKAYHNSVFLKTHTPEKLSAWYKEHL